MCWLQQFTSYYSPLLGTVPDKALSRRIKNDLLTALLFLPKLGHSIGFKTILWYILTHSSCQGQALCNEKQTSYASRALVRLKGCPQTHLCWQKKFWMKWKYEWTLEDLYGEEHCLRSWFFDINTALIPLEYLPVLKSIPYLSIRWQNKATAGHCIFLPPPECLQIFNRNITSLKAYPNGKLGYNQPKRRQDLRRITSPLTAKRISFIIPCSCLNNLQEQRYTQTIFISPKYFLLQVQLVTLCPNTHLEGTKGHSFLPDSYKALHLTHWLLFWELGLSSAGPLLLLIQN